MLALTLLAIEGMSRLAYYAAYGPEYGDGAAADPDNLTPSPPPPPPPQLFTLKLTPETEDAGPPR